MIITCSKFNIYYRFDNILGKETINTFKYLTSEIKSIFCHPTMVDRVAAMLNYFLCHLVGPKKKNFKVSIITLVPILIYFIILKHL